MQRRLLVRIGFVGLCLLPTLVVGVWCLWRHTPGRAAATAEALRSMLGLRVTIDAVSDPRPGRVLIEGLTLADPETGDTILRARTVETHQDADVLVFEAAHLEIEADEALRAWRLVERLLRQELSPGAQQLRLVASEATLHAADGSQTFTDTVTIIGPTGPGQEATLEFRLAGTKMDKPATIRVTRSVADGEPSTRYEFTTSDQSLPCSAFAPLFSVRDTVGSRATFSGNVEWITGPDGGSGSISGTLSHVELDSLVSERFPHTLTGEAEIKIDEAKFEFGRAIAAKGSVSAGPGTVSRSLLTAAAEHLHIGDSAWLPTERIVSYDELSLSFVLDDDGLTIAGQCEDETPGAIMVSDSVPESRRALWREPRDPQPVTALLRTLVPSSQVQVPATRETDWLMHHLPIPEIVPPKPARDKPLPEARLRVGNTIRE